MSVNEALMGGFLTGLIGAAVGAGVSLTIGPEPYALWSLVGSVLVSVGWLVLAFRHRRAD